MRSVFEPYFPTAQSEIKLITYYDSINISYILKEEKTTS